MRDTHVSSMPEGGLLDQTRWCRDAMPDEQQDGTISYNDCPAQRPTQYISHSLFSPPLALCPPFLTTFLLPVLVPIPGVLKNKLGPCPSATIWLKYPLCA